jgi:hypothetical protein
MQEIRQIIVDVIMDNAQAKYREKPQSSATVVWVCEELPNMSRLFPAGEQTILKHLGVWARRHPQPSAPRKQANASRQRTSRKPAARKNAP